MFESVLKRVLQGVFGGGSDISAANPLEVHDPKVGSLISFEGTTTADGAGDGSSLICSDLTTEADFDGNQVIIISGAYAGQARDINGVTTGGTVTPHAKFGGQIVSGTTFVIAAIRTVPAEVAAIEAKLDTQKGASGIFYEQADAAVNITAVNTAETDVLHLSTASTRYIVRSLRLKCADPGANTVTVRLYELMNDVLTEVDSFDITNANFASYHSLMDMFGLPHLAGDELQVTVRASAGGPYAVTGQYSHGKTNN